LVGFITFEHKMDDIEKNIQKSVFDIVSRVEKHGRDSEIVRINLDVILRGQPAINYKVIKLFTPVITDAELIDLLFRLGIQDGTEFIKVLAPQHGIKI